MENQQGSSYHYSFQHLGMFIPSNLYLLLVALSQHNGEKESEKMARGKKPSKRYKGQVLKGVADKEDFGSSHPRSVTGKPRVRSAGRRSFTPLWSRPHLRKVDRIEFNELQLTASLVALVVSALRV